MARLLEGVLKFPNGEVPKDIEIEFTSSINSAQSGVIKGLKSILKVDENGNYSQTIEDGVYDIRYTMDNIIYTQLGKNVSVFYGDPIDLLTLIGISEVANNPSYADNFQALIGSFNTILESLEDIKLRQRNAFTPDRMTKLGSSSPEERLNAIANALSALAGVQVSMEDIDLATDTELEQAVVNLETDLGSFTEFKETFNSIFNASP